MTTTVLRRLALCLCLFVLALPAAQDIPAWSRQYNDPPTDCGGCHTAAGWQLNKRGVAFLRYGHQFQTDLGKKLGERISDIDLSKYNSFAFKARYNGGDNRNSSFELHSLALYSGGSLGQGFSYFGEIYLHENSGKTNAPADRCDDKCADFGDYGRSKLAEAYIQYSAGDEERYVTGRFGQLMPQLLHFNNNGARLSGVRPSLWTKATVNKDNPSQLFSRQYGMDLGAHYGDWHVATGVLNGTGFGPKQTNTVDNDEKKDVFVSADHTFDRYGTNLGVLAYDGSVPVWDTAITTANVRKYTDNYQRYALVGHYVAEDGYGLMGAVLRGKDEIDAQGTTREGQGHYLQPYYYPWRELGFFLRREQWDGNTGAAGGERRELTAGASWMPFELGRLVLDWSRVRESGKPDTDQFTLEVNFQL